ncbi:hypothetical protein T492DRAFT_837456 [Pavlovales sp. CCMP2436]|nr:hypothetical protein T492DRAFT_837456 [Pavlovales sp. CCMP2436]
MSRRRPKLSSAAKVTFDCEAPPAAKATNAHTPTSARTATAASLVETVLAGLAGALSWASLGMLMALEETTMASAGMMTRVGGVWAVLVLVRVGRLVRVFNGNYGTRVQWRPVLSGEDPGRAITRAQLGGAGADVDTGQGAGVGQGPGAGTRARARGRRRVQKINVPP